MCRPVIDQIYLTCLRNLQEALVDLTGGAGEEIIIEEHKMDLTLWAKLQSFKNQKFLLGAGSPTGSGVTQNEVSASGIIQSHAYAILRVRKQRVELRLNRTLSEALVFHSVQVRFQHQVSSSQASSSTIGWTRFWGRKCQTWGDRSYSITSPTMSAKISIATA